MRGHASAKIRRIEHDELGVEAPPGLTSTILLAPTGSSESQDAGCTLLARLHGSGAICSSDPLMRGNALNLVHQECIV